MHRQGNSGLLSKIINPEGMTWRILRKPYRIAKATYRKATKSSIFFSENELHMASLCHPKKLDLMLELYQPRTVLDLGCGTGWSLAYLLDRGVDAMGVEGSALAISKARNPERIECFDLNKELDLGRRFDVLWSVEVVEHIHPSYVDQLLKSFLNHSDRVVMSAAHPGQGGEGHFNEQPPQYWIARFEAIGYKYDATATEQFRMLEECYSENMLVFYR